MNTQGSTSFSLTGLINLAVRLGNGSVTVHTVDDATSATVDLVPGPDSDDLARRFSVELVGPTLTVAAPRETTFADLAGRLIRPRGTVDVVVTVPVGTAVKIASHKAPITVTGRC